MWSDVYLFWNDLKKNSKSVTVTYLCCMSLVSWISVKSINPLPSLFFAFSFGKNKNSSKNVGRIDLPRVPVNKGSNLRLGWTTYSDLYEIVHPSLVLISFCLLTWEEYRKGLLELIHSVKTTTTPPVKALFCQGKASSISHYLGEKYQAPSLWHL